MRHSIGQRLSRCLLAALTLASPLLARGDEVGLAPVIDLNPRHYDAATSAIEEPNNLIVTADAMPLLAQKNTPVGRLSKPQGDATAGSKRPQPAVKLAAPFDPTRGVQPQQQTTALHTTQDAVPLAPVIRVYEPIRAGPRQKSNSYMIADVQPSAVRTPRRSGVMQRVTEDSVSATKQLQKPHSYAPMERVDELLLPAAARPVIQLVDAKPLMAILQPPQSVFDLPTPIDQLWTEEQMAEAEELEAFELDVRRIHQLSTRITPEAGELPKNYAATRFVRDGEIAHRMGFSRAKAETTIAWEAPALCYRPLYFQDINLERHGYKIPLIQPALSAAHFFGRVPLVPYMMVSEGHLSCRYTLGHYRPGDYAPYSLYVPRLRLDASAAELAVAAGLVLAFP